MTTEEQRAQKMLGRRRVFTFVAAFIVISFPGIMGEEADMFLHALDEYAILALAVIIFILILVWRNKQSFAELSRQLNIIEVLFAVAVVFKIYAISVEASDPSDFGDEIPVLILLILTLINRFV